ncbi:PhzF family phenazine biosynthesis protein [Candidatus Clostridium stratigraminis]|uniref:PhzF family phenazine biosynthesis protein n=1 Tax=Candidatus Clostridium stratigraminis TaxID=3381661 RepID=A0ABW8T6J0_9CLOT
MKVKVYTLNAFAKINNGGNPAGVVLHENGLTEKYMKEIAAKVGFSETAFVQESKNADYKLRFFTPNKEVDLCGHATIAAFYLLASIGEIQSGEYTEETKAGVLKVQCTKNKSIFMNQLNPEFYEALDKRYIADSLNIEEELIAEQFPIQIVSTGIRDILIPINSLEALYKVKPDFDKIAKISEKLNVTGYHLFTLETENKAIANCRNFAPLYDIPEEAATGTSSGALSCYLYKYGVINKDNSKNIIFKQGYSMGRPSEIIACLEISDEKIIEVKVGGTALNIKEKLISI